MSDAATSLKSNDLEGLVDPERLARWLDDLGIAPGHAIRLDRISGGVSNESIGIERGDQRFVLRRPAKRALDGADRGMRREFRLLTALDATDVPHPRPVALCEDPDVAGGVAYLMDFVEGFAPSFGIPEPFASDRALAREIPLAAMSALGTLARVDWRDLGLSDFGKPEGFHDRQVSRWIRQLEAYEPIAERSLEGLHDVGAWLDAHRPSDDDWSPGIMHGDYHEANVFIAPDPPARVAAILDWENSTIGDPLLDLASFVRLHESSGRGTPADRPALVARWEASSGRVAPDLQYWLTLSAFKLAIMVEGIYRRAMADPTRGNADAMGKAARNLTHEALEFTRD